MEKELIHVIRNLHSQLQHNCELPLLTVRIEAEAGQVERWRLRFHDGAGTHLTVVEKLGPLAATEIVCEELSVEDIKKQRIT